MLLLLAIKKPFLSVGSVVYKLLVSVLVCVAGCWGKWWILIFDFTTATIDHILKASNIGGFLHCLGKLAQ